jgi:hypothetical protein
MPKVLRRSHLQLKRRGCGRCFCFRSTNTAAQVRALDRGASSPKYRIACRPRCGTCWIRMLTNSSVVYRFRINCLSLVSFCKVLDLMIPRPCETVLGDLWSSYVPTVMLQPVCLRPRPTDEDIPRAIVLGREHGQKIVVNGALLVSVTNTSGYKGVSWSKHRQKMANTDRSRWKGHTPRILHR